MVILPSWSDKTFLRSWGGASDGHRNEAAGDFPSIVPGETEVSTGFPILWVVAVWVEED